MASSLIRGKYVIARVLDRHRAEVIEDGAVFQRDGTIVEVGPYRDLASRHQADEVLGSPEHVVLPGLVNGHHHVGLTPFQLGTPDMALELWGPTRLLTRRPVDLYLDTLYSAFEMIESGVTTVQHMQSRVAGPMERIYEAASQVIRAYQDIGMRVSYSFLAMDQNRFVHAANEDFARRLPADVGAWLLELLRGFDIPLEDNFALFEELHRNFNHTDRVRIQLAPANLHWCSDRALGLFKDCSEKYGVPMHIHLLETMYQKAYAAERCDGSSAVQYLERFGLLGPLMTIGHGVWFTEADVELAAETGTRICHNCSSNLRIRSGVAPLNAFEAAGVRVALGIDEAGINDDRDMLQEIRLALNLHREPGFDDDVPTAAQVLRMATEHGAHTTPFGDRIGILEAGKAADLVLLDWRQIAYPYLDPLVPVVDAVVRRAKPQGVDTVVVAGEPILRGAAFTRVNKEDVLAELARSLSVPLGDEERARRRAVDPVVREVRRFYESIDVSGSREPFYAPSSRR